MREYLKARRALIESPLPGGEAARLLSSMTDEAVRELTRTASRRPPGRWAIAALGGWGAGTLLPASDLDILVLSDACASDLKPFVEEILYPLWDSGLKVGHQVRSPRDQRKAMREELATCTAALTGRPIAGDTEWASAVLSEVALDTRKRRRIFLEEMSARPRPGSPYLLQLDLKDGAGGRRDFDELVWTAAMIAGAPNAGLEPLVGEDLLTAAEVADVRDAAEIVLAARWDVQRGGRGDSVMTLEAALDVRDGAQVVQDAVAATAETLSRARRRMRGSAVDNAPVPFEQLTELLGRGTDALPELESAALTGRLDHLFAGFSSLLTLRRPGLTHELTVGAHSLKAAALVSEVRSNAGGTLAASCDAITDVPALLIAAVVHDVGKRNGGAEHARAGAEPAHDAALACGLRPSRAQDVADLVRLHLALAETALREDVDDEDTVLRAAARIGRRDLVSPLHVLTVVDSMATGPSAWGPWQASLVGALVARIDAALSPEVDGAGLASRGEAVREEALSALDESRVALRRFVSSASLRYLASFTPDAVLKHAHLVAGFEETASQAARTAVTAADTPGAYVLAVAAADRPELFARIAGAISLSGLDILAAEAYGSHDGVALDVFTVTSATLAPVAADTWTRFDRYLSAALKDRLELETRLAERRRHYPVTSKRRSRIDVDPSPGYGTVVRVEAADRVGLLYDLARAIAVCGLDIRWAKAVTASGVARDTFSVVGPDGQAPTDPGVLGHVAMEIRARL